MRHLFYLWLCFSIGLPAVAHGNPERLFLTNGIIANIDSENGSIASIDVVSGAAGDERQVVNQWPQLCVRVCNGDAESPCERNRPCQQSEIFSTDQGVIARQNDVGPEGSKLAQITLAPMVMGQIRVQRKIFGSTTTNATRKNGYVRHYDVIENFGVGPVTVKVRLGSPRPGVGLTNQLADQVPRAFTSEFLGVSPDEPIRSADRWFSLDDTPVADPTACPTPQNQQLPCGVFPSAHVVWGGSARVRPARIRRDFFENGVRGHLAWDFDDLTIQPGESMGFLTYTVIEDNRFDLLEEVLDYAPMSNEYLRFLSAEERDLVVNFSVGSENLGPWAKPSTNVANIREGESVIFQGTGSKDFENDPLEFSWFFDGAATPVPGECVRRIFEDDGGAGANSRYSALSARETNHDENGLLDITKLRVVVTNENPELVLLQTTPAARVNNAESTFERDVFDVDIDEGEILTIDRIEAQDPGADVLSFEIKWTEDQPFASLGNAEIAPKNLPEAVPACPWPPAYDALVVDCATGAAAETDPCAPPAEPWTFEIRNSAQVVPMAFEYPQRQSTSTEYVAAIRVRDDDGGVSQVLQEIRVRVHNAAPKIERFLLNRPVLVEGEVWELSSVFDPIPPFENPELSFSDPGSDPLTVIGFTFLEADGVTDQLGEDGCLVSVDDEVPLDEPCQDENGQPIPGTVCAILAADGEFSDGLYRIRFRVKDNAGAIACRDALLTVNNTPPVIDDVSLVGTGFEGGRLTVSVMASDAGRDALFFRFEVLGEQAPYSGERQGDSACAAGGSHCLDGLGLCVSGLCFGPESETAIEGLPEGEHQIRVVVMDSDGSTTEVERSYTVQNSPPSADLNLMTTAGEPLQETNGLVSVVEGDTILLKCIGNDVGGDELEYGWDFGLGVVEQFTRESTFEFTFRESGLFTMRCEVREIECHLSGLCSSGRSAAERGVNVLNAAPEIESLEVISEPPLMEGSAITFRAQASDPGGDVLSYLFFFGNGAEPDIIARDVNGQGFQTATFTYANEGSYRVRLQVFDGTDYTELAEYFSVSVENAPPQIQLVPAARPVREGALTTVTGIVSDPGNDRLTLEWDIGGDGWTENEENAIDGPIEYSFRAPDDGEVGGQAIIRATVVDSSGAEASTEIILEVDNVAPSFEQFNAPPAQEANLYRFAPSAFDPGGQTDPLTYSLVTPPGNAAIDTEIGMIEWTPSYEEHLSSPVLFIVAATDDEGASATVEFNVDVTVLDDDQDGLPDTYERLTCDPLEPTICLDPNDGEDGDADVDRDGRTAIEEFAQETDPFTFDGPETPFPLSPENGLRLNSRTPSLAATTVGSNRDGTVEIEFSVHGDLDDLEGSLVVSSQGIEVSGIEPVVWSVPAGVFEEDEEYAWRVRAISGTAVTPWSEAWTFVINATNSPPRAPLPLGPSDGTVVDTDGPELRSSTSTDPDGDTLRYIFTVFWPDGEPASSGVGTIGTAANCEGAACPMEVSYVADGLAEDTTFTWTVVALDDEGLPSPPSSPFSFTVDEENAAPSAPVWVAPQPDEHLDTLTPTLRVEPGIDTEGDAVFTVFVIRNKDLEEVQRSIAITADGTEAEHVLEIPLEEDRRYIAEAYTIDDRDAVSDAVQVSFFVSSRNDPPSSPLPLSPDQRAEIRKGDAILIWEASTDPEGDEIRYIVETCHEGPDAAVREQRCVQSAPQEETALSFVADAEGGSEYSWSVRAIDEDGASSEPSTPFLFTVEGESAREQGNPEDGCGCAFRRDSINPETMFFLGAILGLRRLLRRRKVN